MRIIKEKTLTDYCRSLRDIAQGVQIILTLAGGPPAFNDQIVQIFARIVH